MTTLLIVLGVVVVIGFFLVAIYNRLVSLRNQVKNAWGQIDVQLQRRYDLIPNLLETVKGYMQYEKSTLEAVIQARQQAVSAREQIKNEGAPTENSMKQMVGAEAAVRSSLGNIFALAENYPQLRASENMRVLQEELSSTENKIAFARQAYNDQVMFYNTAQQTFPAVMVAGLFGNTPSGLYEIENADARQAVKVAF